MSSTNNEKNWDFTVDVVVPVLNEAHVLKGSIETLLGYLSTAQYRWRVLIVDNGSTDGTQEVAQALAGAHRGVKFLHLHQRGRGRALRHAWLQSNADIVCYTDVDLSTSLDHLSELIGSIAHGGYDLAVGSRLMAESQTRRSLKRETISRIYNLLIKTLFFNKFSDAQCGFKALSRKAVEAIIPKVEDQSWFFDTEVLLLAEKHGYRIKDIPVVWVEDDDSRVKIVRTGWEDVKGLLRVRGQFWGLRPETRAVADAESRRHL